VTVADHPRRAEHLGTVIGFRKGGDVAIQLELQLALATPHAPPAVEKNAGDDNDADDDQPFAQTDIH